MTHLLKSWINDDIKLSKSVNLIEKDFLNGYLMGELLYKQGVNVTF